MAKGAVCGIIPANLLHPVRSRARVHANRLAVVPLFDVTWALKPLAVDGDDVLDDVLQVPARW